MFPVATVVGILLHKSRYGISNLCLLTTPIVYLTDLIVIYLLNSVTYRFYDDALYKFTFHLLTYLLLYLDILTLSVSTYHSLTHNQLYCINSITHVLNS